MIAGLDMIGDSVSRLYHALLLCGQLMTQHRGCWLLQAMQKSPGTAIALASPTIQLIVNLPWINRNPSAKPPARTFCFCWNESTCTFPGCKYDHACYICAQDLGNSNVAHRALDCLQHSTLSRQLISPLFPKKQ